MQFQHTVDAVLDGTKTQTSRIVKENDLITRYRYSLGNDRNAQIICVDRNNRLLWQVGRTYAVQPGRGKKAVARIKILKIRMMDVRWFSYQDCLTEGFSFPYDFWKVWCKMHDPLGYEIIKRVTPLYTVLPTTPLPKQPAEHYNAWVINFELVKGASK